MSHSRYAIGIDLGTTHSVLSYLDTENPQGDANPISQVLPLEQLSQAGQTQALNQLPSFIYQAHEQELDKQQLALPWEQPEHIVGMLARELGSKTPIRLVNSAKSWLCHGGVNRHEDILPFNSPEEVEKISPCEATFHYLDHIRKAWNHRFPEHLLEQQDITITVPASFDPSARELTTEAAQFAGLERLTLLEEPQAAVYSWIENHRDDWREFLNLGDTLLVVDVGGGTTDLSLIAVSEIDGELALERIAVGDHILLGGDNMDLALAYVINQKLSQQGQRLQPWQIQAISQSCRDAKEQLLSQPELNEVAISIPSRGSKFIGGTLRSEVTRAELEQVLLQGFFPQVDVNSAVQSQQRQALTQMGLPYAQDTAITRHLAAFLSKHASDGQTFIMPNAVLLNGGVFKSAQLSQRLIGTINQWLASAGQAECRVFSDTDLDLAVAKGASYYTQIRHTDGLRIRGGLAHSYYIGVETSMPAIPGFAPPMEALCIAPFGMEEGSSASLEQRQFGLVVGEPVQFSFFSSTNRQQDELGIQLDYWQPDELEALPDINVTLESNQHQVGDVIPAFISTRVSELGSLVLEMTHSKDRQQSWSVEFDVRDAPASSTMTTANTRVDNKASEEFVSSP